MISDKDLRDAARAYEKAAVEALLEPEDGTFTPAFERKMKKLIFRVDHPVLYWMSRLLPVLLLGAAGILAAGGTAGSALALVPYLAALGSLALLLSIFRPVWTALPAVIPFAAASALVLSPVFADVTLFFPALRPLSRWLPVTLYLQGCEGDWAALGRLMVLAAVFAAAALGAETLRDKVGR